MSATPLTPRGRETERLMLIWRKQNPDADASAYNREWDAVYRKLEGTFSDDRLAPNAAFDGIADTTDPHMITYVCHNVKPLRPYEFERAAKRRAGTKGAFGKPKHLRRR